MSKEIRETLHSIQIEKVSDRETLQELLNLSKELKLSNNDSDTQLATRIQARLDKNPNYHHFINQHKIEELRLETEKNEEKFNKQQEIKLQNAVANTERRREEIKQNERKETIGTSAKIQEMFNKLNFVQQKMIMELENQFKPELQQEVRAFLLDKNQSTPENFVNIMNKNTDGNHLHYNKENDLITVDANTPSNVADNIAQTSKETGYTAINLGNPDAAMPAFQTMDAANSQKAVNVAERTKEQVEKTGFAWESNETHQSRTNEEKQELAKNTQIQSYFSSDEFKETIEEHNKVIEKIRSNPKYTDEEKEERIKEYDDNLIKTIKLELRVKMQCDFNDENIRQVIGSSLANKSMEEVISKEMAEKLADSLIVRKEYDEAVTLSKGAADYDDELDSKLKFDYSQNANDEKNYQVVYNNIEEENRNQAKYEKSYDLNQDVQHQNDYINREKI